MSKGRRAGAGLALAVIALSGCGAGGHGSAAVSDGVFSPSAAVGLSADKPVDHVVLEVARRPGLGRFLVSGGRALYMYPPDHRRSVTCTHRDGCEAAWPPLFVTASATVMAGDDVQQSMIGSVAGDGGLVVTYHGWPLYYYLGDRRPGEVNGQDQSSDWFVVNPNGRPTRTN